MRKLLLLVAIAAALTPTLARAQDPPRLSFDRVSAGVTFWGVQYDYAGENLGSGFETGAHVTYNLSRRLSIFGSTDRNFEREWWEHRAGGTVQLYGDRPTDRLHVFFGANVVNYDGREVPTDEWSWQGYVQIAATVGVHKWIGAVVGRRYDPENDLGRNAIGLRVQPIGGKVPD